MKRKDRNKLLKKLGMRDSKGKLKFNKSLWTLIGKELNALYSGFHANAAIAGMYFLDADDVAKSLKKYFARGKSERNELLNASPVLQHYRPKLLKKAKKAYMKKFKGKDKKRDAFVAEFCG